MRYPLIQGFGCFGKVLWMVESAGKVHSFFVADGIEVAQFAQELLILPSSTAVV